LLELEERASDIRNRQAVLINDLEKVNIAGSTGSRSTVEWVSSRLDVSRGTASDLVYAARWMKKHRRYQFRLADGVITFDRALATTRLAVAGADEATLDHSESLDLVGVGRLTARQRLVTRRSEREAFTERYVAIQPTLDESSWRLTGLLPGVEGRIVEQALHRRADEFRTLPGGDESTRGQRQADALVAMAMDSLDRTIDEIQDSSGSSLSIFMDLNEANGTGGERGCEIEYGPRVGPNTLEELLCTGSAQIIGLEDGKPVVTSTASRAIPPAVRRLVARRDGGCTIAGCTSRYRLQPHHIRLRSRGGTHDPENLTTLCWFHHHVAIHQQGFRIDPESPLLRRRLIRTPVGPDPPVRVDQ
ncbi:MAG: DUF222 domain-containing protein, partial [Actinomycetota bacterium]|nr:DUF222 domain-containing protein [Actinomycetota bacterium]